jgi:putative ABC transport system permease protein
MPEKIVAFVAKQPHVVNATGVAVYPIGPLDVLTGVDFDRFTRMSKAFRFVSGGPFQGRDDILIDDYFADQRKLKVGDKVRLANHDWTVRGIFASGVLARTMVQLDVLQELTSNSDRISSVYVKVDDPANIDKVIASLKEQGMSDYQIYSLEQFLSLFTPENLPGLSQVMAVIVGLSVLFGFLIVFLAMYTAVLERTREIGILKALGGTPAYVLNILLRETVMLALVGTVIGILLTYVSRAVITSMYPATVRQVIVPDWWPRALLVALTAAVLGVVYPGLKAARQDAVEALTYE